MMTLLTILFGLSMLATVGALFAGVLGVTSGGGAAAVQQTHALRVVFQGVTLLLFVLLLTALA